MTDTNVKSVGLRSPSGSIKVGTQGQSPNPVTDSGVFTVDLPIQTSLNPNLIEVPVLNPTIYIDKYGRITGVTDNVTNYVSSVNIIGNENIFNIYGSPITPNNKTISIDMVPIQGLYPGTYTNANITVDIYGRVLSVTSGLSANDGGISKIEINDLNDTIEITNHIIKDAPLNKTSLGLKQIHKEDILDVSFPIISIDVFGRVKNLTSNKEPFKGVVTSVGLYPENSYDQTIQIFHQIDEGQQEEGGGTITGKGKFFIQLPEQPGLLPPGEASPLTSTPLGQFSKQGIWKKSLVFKDETDNNYYFNIITKAENQTTDIDNQYIRFDVANDESTKGQKIKAKLPILDVSPPNSLIVGFAAKIDKYGRIIALAKEAIGTNSKGVLSFKYSNSGSLVIDMETQSIPEDLVNEKVSNPSIRVNKYGIITELRPGSGSSGTVTSVSFFPNPDRATGSVEISLDNTTNVNGGEITGKGVFYINLPERLKDVESKLSKSTPIGKINKTGIFTEISANKDGIFPVLTTVNNTNNNGKVILSTDLDKVNSGYAISAKLEEVPGIKEKVGVPIPFAEITLDAFGRVIKAEETKGGGGNGSVVSVGLRSDTLRVFPAYSTENNPITKSGVFSVEFKDVNSKGQYGGFPLPSFVGLDSYGRTRAIQSGLVEYGIKYANVVPIPPGSTSLEVLPGKNISPFAIILVSVNNPYENSKSADVSTPFYSINGNKVTFYYSTTESKMYSLSYCYLEPLNLDGFRPSTWIKRCEIYNIEFFGNGRTILPIPNTEIQKTNSVWLTGAKFQKKYGQICVIDNLQTTPKVLEVFQSGEIGGIGTGYVARTTDTFSSSDDQYLIYAAPPVFGERGPLGPPDYSYLPFPSCLDAPFLGSYEVAAGTSITWTDNRYTVGLSPFGMGIGKYFNNVPLKAAHGVFLIKPDFYK